jgi:hypothetical protein
MPSRPVSKEVRVSEKPAEDKLVQDIDRAIEELEAAARSLDAPEVRRTLKALSDAAKAVATIQDAVKAVAVCTENLSSSVVMVKSAKDGV